MFVIWDSEEDPVPYVPGMIRERRLVGAAEGVRPTGSTGQGGREGASDARTQRRRASDSEGKPAATPRIRAYTASQVMSSPVATLNVGASLEEAWQLVKERRFRHVPVLSTSGRLVGILSDRDLLLEAAQLGAKVEPMHAVRDLMATRVITAAPQTGLGEIARVMLGERIGSMPIVDENQALVGIITRSDILRAIIGSSSFELWV